MSLDATRAGALTDAALLPRELVSARGQSA